MTTATGFRTARVAPEKADFRPALPMRSTPGLNGTDMGTMSYREQLLHPKWQRKRLEILSRDGWRCQRCSSAEKTLQVHHKRYVSGRLAWEYDDQDLLTLCADCHEVTHDEREALMAEIASAWHLQADLAEIVRGYSQFPPTPNPPEGSKIAFLAGVAAGHIMVLSDSEARRVIAFADRLFRVSAGLRVDQDAESNPS